MANYKVTCVTKPDRYSSHERITHLGGVSDSGGRWNDTLESVIYYIENRIRSYYTEHNGNIAWLEVRKSDSGRKYVQTVADGSYCNNLLSLDECALA